MNGKISLSYLLIRDMHILNAIRNSWRDEKLKLFIGCLFQIYATRTKEAELLFLQYEPGDYEKAAITAEGMFNELPKSS